MIDLTEVSTDGEIWELFARDFLLQLGFFVESSPDRGADAGKDLLITEELKGHLNRYRFRWLVSCKHFAHSKRSVSEGDEPNILERLEAFQADGFIGFYSTVGSSGLNQRLNQLKHTGKIKDFRLFDGQLIENHLVRLGFSKLLMRYFPASYTRLKPLHKIVEPYQPLECATCGKDLLEALYREDYEGLVAQVRKPADSDGVYAVIDAYWVCKGDCDREQWQRFFRQQDAVTEWRDLSDLQIPFEFMRFVIQLLDKYRSDMFVYTDEAHEKLIQFIVAMAQKVLRESTEQESERAVQLSVLRGGLG